MDYIDNIKEDVTDLLKDFIFEDSNNIVEKIENIVYDIISPYLYKYGLMDFWINVNPINNNKFEVHIGLQQGEHDNTKLYNIDCIVC